MYEQYFIFYVTFKYFFILKCVFRDMLRSMTISKSFISSMSTEELKIVGTDRFVLFLVQQLH